MTAHFIVPALALFLSSCACPQGASSPLPAEPAPETAREVRDGGAEEVDEPDPPAFLCVHQRRPDLGAPAHRQTGGKGGFVRLAECTRLSPIEGDERWLRVAFPATEGRTEGWISKRYVMDCGPCEDDAGVSDGEGQWPPQPRGMCRDAGASGGERLVVTEPVDVAKTGVGAKGRAGARVSVLSFNVWELYDGQGETSYLSPRHGDAAPAKQYDGRLRVLAGALRRLEVDVLVLQEVEGAEVACALASRAWPRSSWTCYGAPARLGGHPQNVAVATRLDARARVLTPASRRKAGPRPALELSIEGAGGLTVTGVHLKSSRGRAGHDDCANARRRMGMAAALARRYGGWSSVLILGDFNVDPLDSEREIYDRTDDVLTGRGFQRICPSKAGCPAPTFGGTKGSAIDLAFFRSGGLWRPGAARVVDAPGPLLGSDHDPLLVEVGQ